MICGMLDPFDPDRFIVRAEVHILGIEPKISRTLELPITLNLAQLHEVLQAAFGWTDAICISSILGALSTEPRSSMRTVCPTAAPSRRLRSG